MVLNHYEHLSMAVLTETADEEIIKASQHHVMSKLYEAFVCYIKKVREINKEPNLYNHFEALVQRWQKWLALSANRDKGATRTFQDMGKAPHPSTVVSNPSLP